MACPAVVVVAVVPAVVEWQPTAVATCLEAVPGPAVEGELPVPFGPEL